jgi:hypothetical protein
LYQGLTEKIELIDQLQLNQEGLEGTVNVAQQDINTLGGEVTTLAGRVDTEENKSVAIEEKLWAGTTGEGTAENPDDGSLLGQYTLRIVQDIDGNRRVAGIGLSMGEETPSEMVVMVDKFMIVDPADTNNQGATPVFTIGSVNGVSQVGIRGELLVDGSVTTDAIKTGTIVIGDLSSEATNQLDQSEWQHDDDVSRIDGGKIYAGSNIVIGDTVDGDYCDINNGDINFYKYFGSSIGHKSVKSLKKVEVGVATNGVTTTLPGYWATQPQIIVSPNNLQSFHKDYVGENQSLFCAHPVPVEVSPGVWEFTPQAELVFSDGIVSETPGDDTTHYPDYDYPEGEWVSMDVLYGNWVDIPAATSGTSVIKMSGHVVVNYATWNEKTLEYDYSYKAHYCHVQARMEFWDGSQSYYTSWQNIVINSEYWNTFEIDIPEQTGSFNRLRLNMRPRYDNETDLDAGELSVGGAEEPRVRIRGILDSFTGDKATTTVVASGTVNYMAISEG